MYSGSVHDNKATSSSTGAGGIRGACTGSNFKIGGTAKIYNNYNNNGSQLCNIILENNKYLSVAKAFSTGANVGVYTATEPSASSPITVTTGTYTVNNCPYITSDRSGFSSLLTDPTSKNVCFGYPALSCKVSTDTL